MGSLCCYAQFEVTGEIRPRAEYRHGFKKLYADEDEHALFVEQRTRLKLNYRKEKIRLGVSLQDVRIWGETAQINKSDGLSSVQRAWGEVLFSTKWSVKLGRQEWVYDDQRILGNLNWAAQGRSHDAMLVKFHDSTWTAHFGLALNQSSDLPEPAKLTSNFYNMPGGFPELGGGLANYKNLQFVWLKKQLENFNVSFLALNTGWQMPDSSVNYLQTVGANPSWRLSNLMKLDGSVYYQFGKNRAGENVNAYLASLNLQYSGLKNMTITFGGDILSGSEANATGSNAFDPLFGTHHKFYGLMDYFYVGNPHRQNGRTIGLIDFFITSKIKTSHKSAILLQLHEFLSPVKIIDPLDDQRSLAATLGTEIDLVFNFDYTSDINLKGGYSQMFATNTMEIIKNGEKENLNNWAWFMITFKPTFYHQK